MGLGEGGEKASGNCSTREGERKEKEQRLKNKRSENCRVIRRSPLTVMRLPRLNLKHQLNAVVVVVVGQRGAAALRDSPMLG